MSKYIKYEDLMDTLEPCEEMDCQECPFYIPDDRGCKWDEFISGLPRYGAEMESE